MHIRDATRTYLPEILAIYNHVIATSNAVYTETAATLDDRRAWLAARRAATFPCWLPTMPASSVSRVLATSGRGPVMRLRSSIRFMCARRRHRRGVGTALVGRLIDEAQRRGKHVMIGGVDAANAASIAMHRKLGFTEAGCLREVARKFGRWLDLVLMQRML